MKSILLTLSVLLSLFAASAQAKDLLSAHQAKIVVSEIDSICGDTWCEGDFGYTFDNFNCNTKSGICTLKFQMACDSEKGPWTKVQCEFKGYDNFFDFVQMNTNDDGKHWYQLRDKFYTDITDNCIPEQEKEMRKTCFY